MIKQVLEQVEKDEKIIMKYPAMDMWFGLNVGGTCYFPLTNMSGVNIWWQTCYRSDGTLCSFFIDKDEVISDTYLSISKTEFCETDILVSSPVSPLCMK